MIWALSFKHWDFRDRAEKAAIGHKLGACLYVKTCSFRTDFFLENLGEKQEKEERSFNLSTFGYFGPNSALNVSGKNDKEGQGRIFTSILIFSHKKI